jgi:AraC-like DNA-binding protein
MRSYIPSTLLRPFIKSYLIIESSDAMVNTVLPDTSLIIAVRLKGDVSYKSEFAGNNLPAAAITGLRKSARHIRYSECAANLLVIFKETGAAAFFKEPLHELFDESVSLDSFIAQSKLSIIEEQLGEAPGNIRRIAIIEKFLLSRLYNHTTDELIDNAVERMYSAKGIIKIKDLSSRLYISNDAFEKRFRKTVGASPKQFSSIIRMRSVIHSKKQHKSFTDTAYEAGYFDQAHFNKDFKVFTGQTPTDFFKSPSFW